MASADHAYDRLGNLLRCTWKGYERKGGPKLQYLEKHPNSA